MDLDMRELDKLMEWIPIHNLYMTSKSTILVCIFIYLVPGNIGWFDVLEYFNER